MSEFKIEKGIARPLRTHGRPSNYPLAEMEVDDSFFVPDGRYTVVGSLVRHWGKNNRRRFTIRKVDGGVRVWRIT